jgi:hypothetical protein
MIFRLELVEVPNLERIYVNLLSKQPHSFGPIRALLDTGSPRTILSATDAVRLSIPFHSLPQAEPAGGFGRGQIPTKLLGKFHLTIKSEDNKFKALVMPVLVADITTLSKFSKEFQENAFKVPTIIGMDFLRVFGFKLVVHLSQHEAFLDDCS